MNSTLMKQFVFKGLLTAQATRELQLNGFLRTPTATADERKEQDLFAPVSEFIRNSSAGMQKYYRVLFVFENVIRELIDSTFTEKDRTSEWFDQRATAQMKTKVNDRKEKEARNRWHVGRNADPIFYLDFGDLQLLIINHWDVFKDFFPNQAWVSSRIQEAERTRNVIAHTNILDAEEGDRLELYVRDWLAQVG